MHFLGFALGMAAIGGAIDPAALAVADRQTLPPDDWQHVFYLSCEAATPESRADLSAAIRLMVASSTLQPIVERSTPIEVAPDLLYRIDLRDLRWRTQDWVAVLRSYPYFHAKNENSVPLVVRADWLLVTLADSSESDAYYRLMFGGDKIPAKRDDWLDLLGVDRTRPKGFDALRWGLIEGQSGVAKQSARWMESHPIARGYAWGTRDVLRVETESDPLESPDGEFKHDGEEWIIGLPKVSLRTGARGALQVYLLSDGNGNRVDRAPVDLVEDSTLFRGNREVVNPGSCIQCHSGGLNFPTTNEFRQQIASGVELYADKPTQEQLEAFHLGDVAPEIESARNQFQVVVKAITGREAVQAAAAFRNAVNRYDAPLSLEDTARELRTTPERWKTALGLASGGLAPIGARLSGLPHGRTIPRSAWEQRYLQAQQLTRDTEVEK